MSIDSLNENLQSPQKKEKYSKTDYKPLSQEWRDRFKKRWTGTKAEDLNYTPKVKTDITFDQFASGLERQMTLALKKEKKQLTFNKKNLNTCINLINHQIGSGEYDIWKGIYLFGAHGQGKSFVLRHLVKYTNHLRFMALYNNLPAELIKCLSYKSVISKMRDDKKYLDSLSGSIMIDDLGYLGDADVNNFGNKMNAVQDIINKLHIIWETNDHLPFITSNTPTLSIQNDPKGNNPQNQFSAKYGLGTWQRLSQMCNIIYWYNNGEKSLR